MIRNLKEVLTKNAPELFARTLLPRVHADYLTQRQAFDLYRKNRLQDLAENAPDLFARKTRALSA
jgi:hypothetical protein